MFELDVGVAGLQQSGWRDAAAVDVLARAGDRRGARDQDDVRRALRHSGLGTTVEAAPSRAGRLQVGLLAGAGVSSPSNTC